jgi:putative hydrolase of the HAD superfamily
LPTQFKYALFDLDNTLVDRVEAVRQLGAQLYDSDLIDKSAITKQKAAELFTEFDKDGYQPDKLKFFTQVAAAWGDMKRSPIALTDWYQEAPRDWFEPDPQVVQLMASITSSDVLWGIISNGQPVQHEKIRLMHLDVGATCILVSATFGVSKPDPSIFNAALEALGNPPSNEVLFVGDNPEADIGGARNVGMKTAWLTRNRQWPTNLTPPDYTLDSILEVRPLLALNQ